MCISKSTACRGKRTVCRVKRTVCSVKSTYRGKNSVEHEEYSGQSENNNVKSKEVQGAVYKVKKLLFIAKTKVHIVRSTM